MDDDDDDQLDEDLREIWSATAPDHPYPLDANGSIPPSRRFPVQVSARLKHLIRSHCRWAGLTGVAPYDAALHELYRGAQDSSLTWFADELVAAVRTGLLTPERWCRLTRTGLRHDDHRGLDWQLQAVWSGAAPGPPYPGGSLPG